MRLKNKNILVTAAGQGIGHAAVMAMVAEGATVWATDVNPELLKVPNVVLTPHIASSTIQTRLAMAQLAADNLIAYLTQGRALTPLNHPLPKA